MHKTTGADGVGAGEFCPRCGEARSGALRFCRSCKFDFEAGRTSSRQPPPRVRPGVAAVAPKPRRGRGSILVGVVVVFVVLAVVGAGSGGNKGGGGSSGQLTGTFLNWVPVDSANGYAYFSVTNSGASAATAKCSVSVKDDFGDFGFDSLVGEAVAPGQTAEFHMALSVGKGSFLINSGDVTGC